MNILVIGNGFDLAHGLPTKYGDFLEFVKVIRQVVKKEDSATLKDVAWGKINDQIKDLIITNKMYGKRGIFLQKQICNELLDKNIWINYFLQCNMYQNENWIDFEREICRVIRSVDDDMQEGHLNENDVVGKCTEPFLSDYFLNNFELIEQSRKLKAKEELEKMEESEGKKWCVSQESEFIDKYLDEHPIEDLKEEITYKQMIVKLEDDLNKLIRALEIYLTEYVGNIAGITRKAVVEALNPDHILSFNYSDTYKKLYDNGKKLEYNYIHGKASINNSVEDNCMVLGFNEYLDDDRKNKDIEFIAFKKYYQRIYKGTGCVYRDWMYKIKESAKSIETVLRAEYPIQIPFCKFTDDARHNLYLFGHSLDVTDKDILRELILNDNVQTKIFYLDKKDLRSKITNLVLVIGQDELIRRTGGSTQTIKFESL